MVETQGTGRPVARKTLLLVEDDAETRRGSALFLETVGYRVLQADSVEIGFHLFQAEKPDLVVLDVGLPDGSGIELCKKIRAHKVLAKTPVIMLTGKKELDDKVSGFEAGADQYLVKPVAPRELHLWAQALLQRLAYDTEEEPQLLAGDLAIDAAAHLVRFRDVTIANLTGKEFDLLYSLVKNRPKVLTRRFILSKLWRTVAVDSVVDTHICNLRGKLPPALADRLQAVPGRGYRYFE